MLAALALALLAQVRMEQDSIGPAGPIFTTPASQAGFAYFEFAPGNGAGMTSACTCGTPAAATGQAITFARASAGYCTKGNWTTGIANGDLVQCSTDEPRVMPGGDGTGVNGLLIERVRTNEILRSTAFDNAAWNKGGAGGASAASVTADAATAPNGTATADRVQFGATDGTGLQGSYIFQNMPTGQAVATVYIKGNGTSGTIDFALWNAGGAAYTCALCSYNSTSWTRCSVPATDGGGGAVWLLGNLSLSAHCNSGAHGAQDVFMWGAQWELGKYPTSFIQTAGVATGRSAETAIASVSLSNEAGSVAATVIAPSANWASEVLDHGMLSLSSAGPTYRFLFDYDSTPTATAFLYVNSGGGGTVGKAYAIAADTETRFSGWWDGSTQNIITPGGSASAAMPTTSATSLIEIGGFGGNPALNGVIKKVCVDPTATRCR